MNRSSCSCPKVCDCQDFDRGLVSNECPEHNIIPRPALTCPVHGEESDTPEKCFACDRPLGKGPRRADTRDDQIVYVGGDCHRKIRAAGEEGYQPSLGGPRLFPLSAEDTRAEQVERMARSRAKRVGKAGAVGMSPEELAMRATLAKTLTAKARWLRKISARGLTLTTKQREIVAREHARGK